MAEFDIESFKKTKFEDRIKEIQIPIFGDSGNETAETTEWTIRGLNAEDLAKVEDAVQKCNMLLEKIDLIAKAVSNAGSIKDKKEAIKEITGLSDNVPSELVRKYVMFELGSVKPKITERSLTIKFAKVYPFQFARIVNEIYALTGMGGIAKKKPSVSGSETT